MLITRSKASFNTPAESVMSCLENEWLTIKDFSHKDDFDYLIQKELPCFNIEVKQGEIVLRVRHYLAKVILPSGASLEILPKVGITSLRGRHARQHHIVKSRGWVAQMLSDIANDSLYKSIAAIEWGKSATDNLAYNKLELPNLPHTIFSDSQQPWYQGLLNIAEAQIAASAKILPNRYQTQVNNSPKAQGRINLKAQLKNNWHRPHYLYSEQSVFDNDKLLSQFLATGWSQLQRLQIDINFQSSKAALISHNPYQGIQRLAARDWLSSYQQIRQQSAIWSAQLSSYQQQTLNQGLQWCWWLLNHIYSDKQSNQQDISLSSHAPTPALMINMNTAFERWVLGKLTRYVEQQLPDSHLVIQPTLDWLMSVEQGQAGSHETCNVVQRLIPDACIRSADGRETHVIDVKYKAVDKIQDVSASDWQQLSVYQQRLGCAHAWLIYPKNKNFNQRLDVSSHFDENRRHQQDGSTFMSVIPFDMKRGALLI